MNDVYNFETDSRNPRKNFNPQKILEGGVLQPEYHSIIRISAYHPSFIDCVILLQPYVCSSLAGNILCHPFS